MNLGVAAETDCRPYLFDTGHACSQYRTGRVLEEPAEILKVLPCPAGGFLHGAPDQLELKIRFMPALAEGEQAKA